MPDVVDDAIKALTGLAPERRDELARFLLSLAGEDSDPELVDPDHLPAILEGLDQMKHEKIASTERIDAAFRRFDT